MATTHQRRADGKAPAPNPEVSQRAPAGRETDAKQLAEQKQALERREEAGSIDAEMAARMQLSMGNAAIAGLLNRGTDTATSAGAGGDLALEEQKEKETEKEEEGEEKEAGEIEHVLPSFSTGGGGGGGGGRPPWSMGRMFGGDDTADAPVEVTTEARWRPMPVLADPDEDTPFDAVDDDTPLDDEGDLDLAEAASALGEAPWRPTLLTRGLRYARAVARRTFGPETLVDGGGLDTALGRARTILAFVARHGDGLDAVVLARAATGAGEAAFAAPGGYAGAVARALSLCEAVVACLPPDWTRLLEIVADGRARARVENIAENVASEGALSATALFGEVLGARVGPAPVTLVLTCHPAAAAALEGAARIAPLPLIDLYTPEPGPRAAPSDDRAAAIDAVLARFTGAPAPTVGLSLEDLNPLFSSMNLLLAAIGGVLAECAAAGVALAPFVPAPEIAGVLAEMEQVIRRGARRLVAAGEALDALVGTEDSAGVRALAGEALAVRATTELARQGCLASLGSRLLTHAAAPADLPDLLIRGEEAWVAGRTDAALDLFQAAIRSAPPELEARIGLAVAGARARMRIDLRGSASVPSSPAGFGEPAFALGESALAAGAHALAAGQALAHARWEDAHAHAAAGLRIGIPMQMPLVVADATCTLATVAFARGADWRAPLLATGGWLRARQDGGALNLLRARWGELGAAEQAL